MLRFLASRLARALVTIVMVVTFAFVVLRLSGDPALLIMSVDAPPEAIAAFREAWGLDEPLWVQYAKYFGAILQGDLGRSMRDGRDAIVLVAERIPVTLALTLPALAIKLGLGIPAGVYAALHRNSLTDRLVMTTAVLGFTVPSFVLGLLLVLVFAVQLGWLPSGGQGTWRHAILPIVTLGIGGAAVLARFTRSAMLEVLGQPYIRTASAKGVPWRLVVRGHALPNAAIPTVTIIGFMVGSLIAGAVVVESVFSWPGVGRLLVVAVANRDLAVVQCILLLVAATMVTSNLVVDLLYGALDPRLRQMRAGGGTLMSDAVMPAVAAPPQARTKIPPAVAAGMAWIALMLAVALLAEVISPYAYTALDLRNRLTPPVFMGGNWAHVLGTDELGRDVLSRLIFSIRMSLLIAFGATIIGAAFGTTMGFLAAHFRGWAEQVVLALVDFSASLPFLILALAVLAFFGNSLTLFIVLLGFHAWERYARIARGLAISAGAQGYAAAVRQLGATPLRVYARHILPNIASTLIISMTLAFPEVILLESGLSFLGLGVQPPSTSLGNMVGYGREYLTRAPWILLAPAFTIILTTLAISLVGDWLRDRLDPTLR